VTTDVDDGGAVAMESGVVVRQPGLFEWTGADKPRAYPLGSLHRSGAPAPAPPRADARKRPPAAPAPARPVWAGWYPHAEPEALDASTAFARLDAYCDGSGTLHATLAGAGVVLCADDVVVCEASICIGCGTNNRAEVYAIGHAVGLAWRFWGGGRSDARPPLTVHSDSSWALGAVSPLCTWNIGDADLYDLVRDVRKALVMYGPVALVHCRGHRPRRDLLTASGEEALAIRGNHRADELAGRGRLAGIARIEADERATASVGT